jgi:integrase
LSLPQSQSRPPDDLIFQNTKGGKLENWDRFQKALFQTSNTNGWHRHDLRRTASSIMSALKVAPSTIEQILAHKDPHRVEGAGAAASHYLHFTRISTDIRDPQEEALSKLAETLISIEEGRVA